MKARSNGQVLRERKLPGPVVAAVPAQLCSKGGQAGSQGCRRAGAAGAPCGQEPPGYQATLSPEQVGSVKAPRRRRGRTGKYQAKSLSCRLWSPLALSWESAGTAAVEGWLPH